MAWMKEMSISYFLPLSRMSDAAATANVSYCRAKPFPHIVFDNFFDPRLVDDVLAEFPKPEDIPWQKFDNAREKKLASAHEMAFGPTTRLLLYHLNSITFLEFLTAVTGIDN